MAFQVSIGIRYLRTFVDIFLAKMEMTLAIILRCCCCQSIELMDFISCELFSRFCCGSVFPGDFGVVHFHHYRIDRVICPYGFQFRLPRVKFCDLRFKTASAGADTEPMVFIAIKPILASLQLSMARLNSRWPYLLKL